MIVNSAIEYRKWVKDKEVRLDAGKNSHVLCYRECTFTNNLTIDPTRSELYGGQQVTYVAPYTRCDRVADNRHAWPHLDKLFNN